MPPLTLALRLSTFLGLTAGYRWRASNAQLDGNNGMSTIPAFQLGEPTFQDYAFFYLVYGSLLVCYTAAHNCVNAHHGQVLMVIVEDVLRTELRSYDVRLLSRIG